LLHVPVAMAQVPASWHSSCAMQTTGVPAQTPAEHMSAVVQALLSSLVVADGKTHAPVALQAVAPHGAVPVHVVVQQKPPRQAPIAHWLLAMQLPVFPLATQWLRSLEVQLGPPACRQQ
jgi:hypothetical protein